MKDELLKMAQAIASHADSGRITWDQATKLTNIAERLEELAMEYEHEQLQKQQN